MAVDRHNSRAGQSEPAGQTTLMQEYPHFQDHMDEVGDELGRIARWGYLAWVAFWVVALSVLAFATVAQGPVGF